ncbi:MAG: CHAD domain containing protein, partial [Gammaproteobacteria bacterium BRH_c0]
QRRLRSLIRLFAPALPEAFVRDWNQRLRDNASSLGGARDLDVLCDEILAPVVGTTTAEIHALTRLTDNLTSARQAKREVSSSTLNPASQGRLLLAFSAALHDLPTNNLIGAVDMHAFAALQLDAIHSRVSKRYKSARKLVPEKLHALRITLKGLRYAMEFFAPLMPGKSVARYLQSLTRTQNALGFINDLDVARTQLAQRAADDIELQLASAFVCGWHGPRYHKLSQRAVDELGALLKGKAPWHD